MQDKQNISKENIKDYILHQIEVTRQSSMQLGLKFLPCYLELAEQVLDEELDSFQKKEEHHK